MGGCGNIARHNEIHSAPQLAIRFWGNDHLIEYNEIYDVLKHADDMGAIYTGKSWINRDSAFLVNGERDNVITGNLLANITPTSYPNGVFYGALFFASIGISQDMSHLYQSLERSNYKSEQ